MKTRKIQTAPPDRMHAWLGYVLATSGPVSTAGAHFALSLLLLHTLLPSDFGQISFLLVISQLSGGLWSALFCAPLPVMLTPVGRKHFDTTELVRRCMFATNIAGASVAMLLFALAASAIGLSLGTAILFAMYAACFLLRWLARSDAYAAGKTTSVVASDLTYGGILLTGLSIMGLYARLSLTTACTCLLVAAVLSLLPFGTRYLSSQFVHVSFSDIRSYARIWRLHSRWSLVGVLTTEMTANSHAYLLTIFLGPASFAPIAASALLIRPISVIVNALIEFDRPRVAAQIGRGDMAGALASLRFFRLVSTLTWIGSALGALGLLALAPQIVFPARYDLDFLIVGTALWMAVALIRQWRAPESILLQAGGEFRELAKASIASSIVSVFAVVAFLWLAGPLWSIMGILVGETVCAVWTRRQARHFYQQAVVTGATSLTHECRTP